MPTGLLTGADIRKVIRSTLGSIAENQRAEVDGQRIKVGDEVDKLEQEYENMEMDIMELEKVIALNDRADDQADDMRNVGCLANTPGGMAHSRSVLGRKSGSYSEQYRGGEAGAGACTSKTRRAYQRHGCKISITNRTSPVGCYSLDASKSFLMAFARYREQLDKVARLKEDTVRSIVKSSIELGLFKGEVSRHLKQLRDFVKGTC
jgi:kinetochore protein NDC80